MMEEIWDALESTAFTQDGPQIGAPRTASLQKVGDHRRAILRFLEEISGDTTVIEVREALDAWESR